MNNVEDFMSSMSPIIRATRLPALVVRLPLLPPEVLAATTQLDSGIKLRGEKRGELVLLVTL